jgi:hypothetical protein
MPNVGYSFVSAAAVDEIITDVYGRELIRNGFVLVAARTWSRTRAPWARDLFQVSSLKGAGYIPRWGFCLPFVPQVGRGRLTWHRGPKSKIFDLLFDPMDLYSERQDWEFSRIVDDESELREAVRAAAPAVMSHAIQTWNDVTTMETLSDLFERRRAMPTARFRFENIIQHPIAYAFTLAKVGRLPDAKKQLALSHYMKDADDAARLLEALEETCKSFAAERQLR